MIRFLDILHNLGKIIDPTLPNTLAWSVGLIAVQEMEVFIALGLACRCFIAFCLGPSQCAAETQQGGYHDGDVAWRCRGPGRGGIDNQIPEVGLERE